MTRSRSRARGSGAYLAQPAAGPLKYSQVPRAEWQSFFERLSDSLPREEAEVEVIGVELDDTLAFLRKRLVGISYVAPEDTLRVHVEQGAAQLGHAVLHPNEIHVQHGADGVAVLAIVTEDGRTEFVRFRSPLPLRPRGRPRAE